MAAPVIGTIPDYSMPGNSGATYWIPADIQDSDGDVNWFATTLTLEDGSPLPDWFYFMPVSRGVTASPPAGVSGDFRLMMTVYDYAGNSASAVFTFSVTPVNDAPVVALPIADQTISEDTAWTFQVPAGTFTDADSSMTYSASLADGSALPGWLTFNAAIRTFTGTPPANWNGTLDLRVTASDGSLSASDDFTLTVTPVNDAPSVATAISDQTIAEDTAWTFQVPGGAFGDVDGDALTYAATMSDGSGLPAWLSFDAATRTFTGTPPANFSGALDIRVTASDGSLNSSDTFRLTVTPVNDGPVLSAAIADQAINENTAWTFQIPAGTFTDVDNVLTYSAQLADGSTLPSWLSFNAATRTFSGTPPANWSGVLNLRVTASDGLESVTDDFTLTVNPVNDAPTVAASDSVSTPEGTAITQAIDATDADGDSLSYSLKPGFEPANGTVTFNAATGQFTYTPAADYSGADTFTILVDDGNGGISEKVINVTVTPVNDAPVLNSSIPDQTIAEDAAWSFTVPAGTFTDVDSALLYTARLADGSPLPGWLAFNAATQTFTGTPPAGWNGTLNIRVTAHDGAIPISDDFTLTVTPVNDAPVVSSPVADQNVNEDTAWTYTIPAGAFTDVDNALTFSATQADGSALPAWLSFNTATRTFTGTPPADWTGFIDLRVTASDGSLDVSDAFRLTVNSVNDVPVLVAPIADQAVNEDTAWTFQVPAGSFTDADGLLTYSASLANGNPLPAWLVFNAATQTFTGTPPANWNGYLDIRVSATDGSASVSDTFRLTVDPVNDVPVVSSPVADQNVTETSAWTFTVPAGAFADVDSVLTYSATLADGSALPAWLSFNAATRTFSGTPPLGSHGVLSLRVTASDGSLSVQDDFDLTIARFNHTPTVSAPVADQTLVEDTAWSFTVPGGAFADIDGDALTYSATLADNSPLPAWLSFNAATQTFTGTPPANFNGVIDLKVTASDGSLSVSDTFKLAITGVNDAPVTADDLAYVAEDTGITVDVLGNDTDVDSAVKTLTSVTLADPTQGTVTIVNNAVRFTPAAEFNGTVTVTYTVSDGSLQSTGTLTVIVTPVNDAPVASTVGNSVTGVAGAPISGVLPAALDKEGNALTYRVAPGTMGLQGLTLNADGTFTYVAPPGASGPASFLYQVVDSDGGVSTPKLFTINITSGGSVAVPGGFSLGSGRVWENAYAGSTVMQLKGWTTGTYTYTLLDDANGRFEIVGDRLVVKTGTLLDYETAASHQVQVRVTGPGGVEHTETVTVSVSDQLREVIVGTLGADTLRGGAYDDNINGDFGDDSLVGAAGNDTLSGGVGNDLVDGGEGNDAIGAGTGTDTVFGGGGNDTISGYDGDDVIDGGDGNDRITGGYGHNTITGGNGADTLDGNEGHDQINGGAGIDTINGGTGNDVIDGGDDRDIVTGGAGNDSMLGGAGNDDLVGLDGHDTLNGGDGPDVLVGGLGNDVFVFDTAISGGATTADRVSDFLSGQDKIWLDGTVFGGVSAGTLAEGAFQLGPVAKEADDRVIYNKLTGELFYDADGNGGGAAVVFAYVTNKTTLSATDFMVI